MKNSKSSSPGKDTLLFAKESKGDSDPSENQQFYKLLIVDDEKQIHIMTKLVLSDYQYKGAGLKFLSAFSGKEAKEILEANPDIVCCLLDVVMETKNAGLDVARFIREDLKNSKLRIILRTGQPGRAPEKEVILNYDINDYKEKTELTTQKLFTTITTAIRSYIHLEDLEDKTREIESKNQKLNEEIARRIVAESNLTKYNRSLERMIEIKSNRLKEAIDSLEQMEEKWTRAHKATLISGITANSIDTLDASSNKVKSGLDEIGRYREQLSLLLEKYNTLEQIIIPQLGDIGKGKTEDNMNDILAYKKEIDLDSILAHYPEIIKDSTKGIDQIAARVQDIKEFIAISDQPNESVNINNLLANMVERSKQAIPSGVEIQTEFQELGNICIPVENIKKAIQEVFNNGIQAVAPQGIVSISTHQTASHIKVCISDLGKGISQDHLPHIFTPYFSGNPAKSKGLGLFFAKNVIQGCNGKIEVASTKNEGSTVLIELPLERRD